MKLEELFESPQYTFPQDFNLDNDTLNRQRGRELLKDPKKQAIKKIDNYTLYEFSRAYALIENDTSRIVYLMQYKTVFHKFIGHQCVQQILVWRDRTVFQTKDLASDIFFNHLLQNYHSVITDSVQTPDGAGFWDIRIAEAIKYGFKVYFVSLIPHREIVQIHSANEFREIRKNKDIWGDETKHQARRIIITTKDLG